MPLFPTGQTCASVFSCLPFFFFFRVTPTVFFFFSFVCLPENKFQDKCRSLKHAIDRTLLRARLAGAGLLLLPFPAVSLLRCIGSQSAPVAARWILKGKWLLKCSDGERLHPEGSIFHEEEALRSVSYLRECAHLHRFSRVVCQVEVAPPRPNDTQW